MRMFLLVTALTFLVGCTESPREEAGRLQKVCIKKHQDKILGHSQKCWNNLAGSHSEELDKAVQACSDEVQNIVCPWDTK